MQIALCSKATAIYLGATLSSFLVILLLSNTSFPEANAEIPNSNLLHSVIKILNRYLNTTNNATAMYRRNQVSMSSHLAQPTHLANSPHSSISSASNLSSSATRRVLLWLTITNESSNASLAGAGDDQPIRSLSAQTTLPRTYHNIRHHGKHHKINSSSYWHRHREPDVVKSTTSSRHNFSSRMMIETNQISDGAAVTQQNNDLPLSDIYNTSFSFSDNSDSDSEVRKQTICYNTNEVLIIIGLTCFLNFTFIMLVMTCVHFCSTAGSSSKVADYPRLESLVLGDSELSSKRTSSSGGMENIPSFHDHTDSMPLLFRPSSDSMVSLHSISTSFCPLLRARPSFTPLVQDSTCYLDCKIPPSLSMENLLFTN